MADEKSELGFPEHREEVDPRMSQKSKDILAKDNDYAREEHRDETERLLSEAMSDIRKSQEGILKKMAAGKEINKEDWAAYCKVQAFIDSMDGSPRDRKAARDQLMELNDLKSASKVELSGPQAYEDIVFKRAFGGGVDQN